LIHFFKRKTFYFSRMTKTPPEYEEEDLDSLLDGSYANFDESSIDLDSLLKPLSDSQQAIQDGLDLKDKIIRDELSKIEEDIAKKDHHQLVEKHQEKLSYIKRCPPGLLVFDVHVPIKFSINELNLERDFGWSGRERLEKSGLSPKFVDSIIGGGNLLKMVRYLTPETGQNNMISNEEEFGCIADYIFYLCSVCEDKFTYSILSKCLFDLLKNSGYSWNVSVDHLLVPLLNLGGRSELILSEDFYNSNLKKGAPKLPRFFEAKASISNGSKFLEPNSRIELLNNTVHLIDELLRMPFRNQVKEDVFSVQVMVFLAVISGLDSNVVDDPIVSMNISSLIDTLVSMLPSELDDSEPFQDLTEMLTTGFMPKKLCISSTTTWSYQSVPSHLEENGYNHPHNMLSICLFFPLHSSARQVLCYLFIQLILGVNSIDLPNTVALGDFSNLFINKKDHWKKVSKDHYYSTWSIICFLDLAIEGILEEWKVGSESFEALKYFIGLLEQLLRKSNMTDPLHLDPVKVGGLASEIKNRWKLYVNKTENEYKLKTQTSQSEVKM